MMSDFAKIALRAKAYGEAQNLYLRALELDADHLPAYVGLSTVFLKWDKPEKAVKALQMAFDRDLDGPELWNEVAVVRARTGDYMDALVAIQRALSLDPENPMYLTNYAAMLAAAGEYEASARAYERVLSPAEAHFRVAGALYSRGDEVASVNRLKMALRADPNHRQAAEMLERLTDSQLQPVNYSAGDSDRNPLRSLNSDRSAGSNGRGWSASPNRSLYRSSGDGNYHDSGAGGNIH